MKIDDSTLSHLEKLAKITIDSNDREIAKQKMQAILNQIETLDNEVLNKVDPLYHPLEIHQRLRIDYPDSNIPTKTLQKNAPLSEGDLFLVPKVIE